MNEANGRSFPVFGRLGCFRGTGVRRLGSARGAPSREGRVVNGRTTKTAQQDVGAFKSELQPARVQCRTITTTRMTDIWRGNTDIVGGKLAEYLPQISMSEQKLSKRLREVVRFEARISDELSKNVPCRGAVRRDLLEMELAALKRDRVSIKEKLLQVLLFDPHTNFEGSEQVAEYYGRAPPEAVNRPATSDSVCGRYTAYSGEESGGGVWSRPRSFGVLDDKPMKATAEGIHGAEAQAAVDIKRRRIMDNATSGFSSAAPSLRWGGDMRSPINDADRDGIGNMVSWQRENSEMLCQPPRPSQTHRGSRQWVAPPLASLNIRSPYYRTFDTLEPCSSSPDDLNGVSSNKAPFHVPTVLPRASAIFSNNRHGTPTLHRRGNYSPPYQSPTSEAWPAYTRDRQLDEVHADDVERRGQQYSERCSVSMTRGDWQQRVGHNRFVQTGGWSEEEPVTPSGRVKRWRRRSMPMAIPIDARQGEGAISRPYPGRNGDFPKYSAWDTGFHQQNIPQQPTGVYLSEKAERSKFML